MDCENKESYDRMIRIRIIALAVVFSAWLLIALGRAWYLAVPGRNKYTDLGEKMARSVVTIPAPRGRILDADGVMLAWSEHFYDLETAVPGSALNDAEIAALKKLIPDMDTGKKPLRSNLTPGEVNCLKEMIRSGVRVKIVPRNERIVIVSPEPRRRVGSVKRTEKGSFRGVSGWEKEFDRQLSGSPGRISVMLDRKRNWIHSSVKVLTPMVPGQDVRLRQKLRELEPSGGEASNAR